MKDRRAERRSGTKRRTLEGNKESMELKVWSSRRRIENRRDRVINGRLEGRKSEWMRKELKRTVKRSKKSMKWKVRTRRGRRGKKEQMEEQTEGKSDGKGNEGEKKAQKDEE